MIIHDDHGMRRYPIRVYDEGVHLGYASSFNFVGGGIVASIVNRNATITVPYSLAVGGPVTGGTPGSVLFVGAGSILAQDNTNLFWDDTNDILKLRRAKLISGSLLAVPEAGVVEFDTDKAYLTLTSGAARREFTLNDSPHVAGGAVPYVVGGGRLVSSSNFMWGEAFNRLYLTSETQMQLVLLSATSTCGIYMAPNSGDDLLLLHDTARFSIYNYDTSTHLFSVLTNGRVGVGMVNPDVTLDVFGAIGITVGAKLHLRGGADPNWYLWENETGNHIDINGVGSGTRAFRIRDTGAADAVRFSVNLLTGTTTIAGDCVVEDDLTGLTVFNTAGTGGFDNLGLAFFTGIEIDGEGIITFGAAGNMGDSGGNLVFDGNFKPASLTVDTTATIGSTLEVMDKATLKSEFVVSQYDVIVITADNTAVTVADRCYMRIQSDSGTAGNRTIKLHPGVAGQIIIIEGVSSSNAWEILNGSALEGGVGAHRLQGDFTGGQYTMIILLCNGLDWVEIARK